MQIKEHPSINRKFRRNCLLLYNTIEKYSFIEPFRSSGRDENQAFDTEVLFFGIKLRASDITREISDYCLNEGTLLFVE